MSTGWFLVTDIFNCLITRYLKAHESFNDMKNVPDSFPFWYLVSTKFQLFSNYPSLKTFEASNCEIMENTLKFDDFF